MIQILLLITILISFARVINAPKKLLAEPPIERTVPIFHTFESRSDDNVLATDVLVDNQNDGVDGTAATKDMEEAVSENKAVLDDTEIPLKDDNPSKNDNSNKTEANNNTQIIIPESCKDLEMIYSNDEEADSKWWKTVHTMKGQSLHILHISLQQKFISTDIFEIFFNFLNFNHFRCTFYNEKMWWLNWMVQIITSYFK